jgi:hypothetical protein
MQEENDLLSELLFQNSRVTNIMTEVWVQRVLNIGWFMDDQAF